MNEEDQQAAICGRDLDAMLCRSCGEPCAEHLRCEICHEPGCVHCLIEIETGEKVCENCKEIAITPLHVAAKRAARTGTHRDLQKYLQARKRDVA